jgi:SWI/SNF related-matrix-associated actin-dependent regulator of chromatin subfamily C
MTKSLSRQIDISAKNTDEKKEKSATPKAAGEAGSPSAAQSTTPAVKSEGTTEEPAAMDVEGTSSAPAADASSPAASEASENAESMISKSASIALGTSAARAAALASHEEREMTRLVNSVVNHNLRKLELKLNQFNELEQVLQAERREIEKARQQLFLERLAMKRQCRAVQEQLKRALQTGGPDGYRMAVQASQMGGQGQMLGFEQPHQQQQQPGVAPQMGARPPSLENPSSYVAFEA